MRTYVSIALFAFAVALAACGGGGGGNSSALPTAGGTSGGSTQPAKAKNTTATMRFYIPPTNKQNARSKPLYISSATQAFGVYVEAYPSVAPTGFPSPMPTGIQIFPVATPSPCAISSGGGETCTFTVTAPIGTDLFVVAALPTATIGPGTTPLSAYLSGPVVVSLSPAPNASPLSFTLNGVVNTASVAVESPDPNNTPNTKVFTALVPTSAPLAVTAYDSNNNVVLSPPTQAFFQPIVIDASPAADGVTLSLIASSQCGSTASGAQASIACAGDLSDLLVSYDGSTHPDSSDHAISAFTVTASAQPNPSPSPASIVLASNLVTYSPLETGTYVSDASLIPNPAVSGQLIYVFNASTPEIGTFTTSSGTVGTPVSMSGVGNVFAMTIAPNGTFWVIDNDAEVIDCWSTLSGALAGSAPTNTTGIAPLSPASNAMYVYSLTADGSSNVWFTGYDETTGNSYAGYIPASTGCPATAPAVTAQFTLNGTGSGDTYESSRFAAPLSNGIAFNSSSSGLYEISTGTTPTTVTAVSPALGAGSNTGGVAVDPAGNTYAAFVNYSTYTADLEWLSSGGALSALINPLVPSNNSVSNENAAPYGLSVFSPTNGIADRASYVDDDFEALGLADNLHATTHATMLDVLPTTTLAYQTAYGPNGAVFVLYLAYSGSTYTLNIARAVNTPTWAAPVTAIGGGGCTTGALYSINERGDSGPFTIVANPANITFTQLPGGDHDFWAVPSGSTETVQLTITDVNGRQMSIQNFSESTGSAC